MTDIKFSATGYEQCRAHFIQFRNANRDADQREAYFDGRKANRPGGPQPIIVWAETVEGKRVGSLSLVPHHYLINNAISLVGVLGDISVERAWRGKGIAKRMFGFLAKLEEVRPFAACIVLPNDDA